MSVRHFDLEIRTSGKGMLEITGQVADCVRESGVESGCVTVFCRHTSCSLVLMENADPTARRDLERFMEELVPEETSAFEHTLEGPDDMPSHIRMALTRTTETIPVRGAEMCLGTWQGLFLWEHRRRGHRRHLVVTVMG